MAVLLIAKNFLQGHPKAGTPTNFGGRIESGWKKHTVRQSYTDWKNMEKKVNEKRLVLDIHQWSANPYSSKQEQLMTLRNICVETFQINSKGLYYVGGTLIPNIHNFVYNDGFTRDEEGVLDFEEWIGWERGKTFNGCLIYLTDFRY